MAAPTGADDPTAPTSTDDDGSGAAPTPDDERWIALRDSMTAPETLARLNANARATVGAVATVGTLLTVFGLVAAQTVLTTTSARWLALASVAVAVAAVVAALLYLGLRLQRLRVRRLNLVKRWYNQQIRRALLAVAASWLLVAAVLLAAVAGVTGIIQSGPPVEPSVGLTLSGAGEARRLDVRLEVSGIPAGSAVAVVVRAEQERDCGATILLNGMHLADRSGKVSVTSSVTSLPCNMRYTVEVSGDDIEERTLTIPKA